MPLRWFPKRYADLAARLRVPSGFLLIGAFAWWSAPDMRSIAIGTPLSILGLLLRAWAAGHLAKNQQLATSGPYSYARNPLYLGTLLVAAGMVIGAKRWELAFLFGAAFAFIYLPVMQLEEQHLRGIFLGYAEYASRVPALLPRRPAHRKLGAFRLDLYVRNQEYQALLAFLASVALLFWKAWE